MRRIGIVMQMGSRRDMLRLGVGAAALASRGSPVKAQTTLEVMLPNINVSGRLREIIEKDAGVKISDAPFQSTQDAISRVVAPGGTSRFSLVAGIVDFTRDPILGQKAGDEKASALDMSKIPNAARLAPSFKSAILERDGRIYALPSQFGYNTVLYNRERLSAKDELLQSWGAIFEDKYAGEIGWFESPHQMIFAAAIYLGKEKPATMTDAEVREVGDFLVAKKKNVRVIWTSFAQCANLFATGEIVVGFGVIPVRMQLEQQGVPIANAWPKEGVESFVGVLFIPKDSANQDKAHAAINAILSDAYAKELPKVAGYLSANASGEDGLNEEEKMQSGYGILTGKMKHHAMPLPANYNTWVEEWSRVKSA